MMKYIAYSKSILDYLKYLSAEFLLYNNYLNAIVIGAAVNLLAGNELPGNYAPYIIPVIVQSISKSALKYKNRHMERLLQLPSEREDPVFIMNEAGDIILSTGLTLKNFKKNKITNIKQIIGEDGYTYLSYSFYDDTKGNKQTRQIDMFSEFYKRWYEIKIKYIISILSKHEKEFLIWFTDITELKIQEKKMSNMLKFSDDIISSLPMILEKYVNDDVYYIVAEPLLRNGYHSVFIGQLIGKENKLKGLAFKYDKGDVEKSNIVEISEDINSILDPDGKTSVDYFNLSDISKGEEFERNIPLKINEKLNTFVNCQIENYITYMSANVFVIAFNKTGVITEIDKVPFEILAKNINTFTFLQNFISSYFIHYLKALNEDV